VIRALRSAAFAVAFYAVTAVIGIGALPLLVGPRGWVRPPLRLWAKTTIVLLRWCCDIRVSITGAEFLPTQGGAALIASRHESAFDTVVWLALLPHPAYVLKRELLRIPVYGWLAWRYGMIPVDRSAGASAMRALLRAGRVAFAAGQQVVIFPEGTRIRPAARVPFQPGIAALATLSGLPVIPVATNSGRCWARGLFGRHPGTITIAVLPPLPEGLPRVPLLARLEATIWAAQSGLDAHAPVDVSVDGGADGAPAAAIATRDGR
jgi:1-acyl-sn-glycerol-3-phosphate acyltransferase